VLREACRQVRRWQDRAGSASPFPTMSVNLSARQFTQPDLVAQIARTVQETGIQPAHLKLEVTESVLMQEPDTAAAMLAELGGQGVRTCIDDFGTGYSSLSYLMRLPAHTIKIDRSFVTPISSQMTLRPHVELVRTIVALAHNLGMDVVAEGVETEDQLQHLRAIQCDFVQGYLLSRPVDATAAERLLDGGPLPRAGRPGD
jgi:EAL domain-containing protein (putative c-di-GMP-specific phosphodiesterase class I)